MTDTDAKFEAMEKRMAALEHRAQELCDDFDRYAKGNNEAFDKLQKWVVEMDAQYQKMMRNMYLKAQTCFRYAEVTNPMIMEIWDAVFPERKGFNSKDLGVVVKGSQEIN